MRSFLFSAIGPKSSFLLAPNIIYQRIQSLFIIISLNAKRLVVAFECVYLHDDDDDDDDPTPQPTDKRRSVDVWDQTMKTCATVPSDKVPVANGRFHGFDSIGVPDLRSCERKRSIKALAAAMWMASPLNA